MTGSHPAPSRYPVGLPVYAKDLFDTLVKARHWINDECERRGKADDKYEEPASAMVELIDGVLAKAGAT